SSPIRLKRIICAMPRASLRSVLLICAFSTARIAGSQHRSPANRVGLYRPVPCEDAAQPKAAHVTDTPQDHFPLDPARVIHNADPRVLDRNVQSRKIIHAALLLLMLEAAHADLVSPSA